MNVVSDTTPLNYLVLLNQVEVLPRLYGMIHVPTTVLSELSADGTPDVVRDWAGSPPDWLRVLEAPEVGRTIPVLLDQGERDAIQLALAMGARTLLTDDWRARAAAAELQIATVTTLLVLAAAADRGWLDLGDCFARLRRTNFRLREETLQEILSRRTDREGR